METLQGIMTLPGQRTRAPRRPISAACETCRRRKERCSGVQPCQRCSDRGVGRECYFVEREGHRANPRKRAVRSPRSAAGTHWPSYGQQHPPSVGGAENRPSVTSPAGSEQYSRMIRDRKGSFMFIGDSANLSFLQIIRRVASDCVGSCPFVDDPLRYFMVEASPEGQSSWLSANSADDPPDVSLTDAQDLVKSYVFATNCFLSLFDEAELLAQLPAWTRKEEAESSIPRCIVYLVLAIGAQTTSEDKDDLAERLFTHGRYLAARSFMEDASMSTVQAYALVTLYLLGACRRNAAFIHLGVAVRAGYAIGLHRKDIAATFSEEDCIARERLWKGIRSLDLFMSASLGRPPSTSETRDTEANDSYSASNDLCAIFEKILIDVYSRRMISTDALSSIGSHHRRWASRFFRGLETDKIDASDVLVGGSLPNIGLMHLKAGYYWSIILLTRPFLVESVTLHTMNIHSSADQSSGPCTTSDSNKVLINACVDSAIRTIDLLRTLLECDDVPKRLPFLSNSVFIAALVLGFAYFGDLYQTFPLQRHLKVAHQLLLMFSHDIIAQRNASIVEYLCSACEVYLEKRTVQKMDHQSLAIGSMFGQIHRVRTQTSSRDQSPGRIINTVHNSNGDAASPRINGTVDAGITAQQERDPADPNVEDYRYAFDLPEDFSDMPLPPMTPRTLWFDSLDGNMPLFSTIANSNIEYATL